MATTDTNDRKIVGSILKSGRLYKAGEEDALAKVLPAADRARLVEAGQLSGDWSAALTGDGSGEALPPGDGTDGERTAPGRANRARAKRSRS